MVIDWGRGYYAIQLHLLFAPQVAKLYNNLYLSL